MLMAAESECGRKPIRIKCKCNPHVCVKFKLNKLEPPIIDQFAFYNSHACGGMLMKNAKSDHLRLPHVVYNYTKMTYRLKLFNSNVMSFHSSIQLKVKAKLFELRHVKFIYWLINRVHIVYNLLYTRVAVTPLAENVAFIWVAPNSRTVVAESSPIFWTWVSLFPSKVMVD